MTMEQILKAIEDQKSLIKTHECLLDDMKQRGTASIACRGSWAVAVDYNTARDIVDKQLESLREELGRLLEAKKAGEITMEGWLNQSRGG